MLKTTIIATTMTMGLFTVVSDFQQGLPVPVEVCREDPKLTDTRVALQLLGRDTKFAKDIFASASAKSISPVMFACLIETESEFKITAKSNKGYKGLGQTPKAVMKTGFELGDLTYAACVFDEKLKISCGDVKTAMMLYKGGRNPAAKKEAAKVFALYEKINKQIKERQNG